MMSKTSTNFPSSVIPRGMYQHQQQLQQHRASMPVEQTQIQTVNGSLETEEQTRTKIPPHSYSALDSHPMNDTQQAVRQMLSLNKITNGTRTRIMSQYPPKPQTGINFVNLDLNVTQQHQIQQHPQYTTEATFLKKKKMQMDTLPCVVKMLSTQPNARPKKIIPMNIIHKRNLNNMSATTSAAPANGATNLNLQEDCFDDFKRENTFPDSGIDVKLQLNRSSNKRQLEASQSFLETEEIKPWQNRQESPPTTSRSSTSSFHYPPGQTNQQPQKQSVRIKSTGKELFTPIVFPSVDHPYYQPKQQQQQHQQQPQTQNLQQQQRFAETEYPKRSLSKDSDVPFSNRPKYLLLSKIPNTSNNTSGNLKKLGNNLNTEETEENVELTNQLTGNTEEQGVARVCLLHSQERNRDSSASKGQRNQSVNTSFNDNLSYFGVKLQSCSLQRKKENISPTPYSRSTNGGINAQVNRSNSNEQADYAFQQIVELRKIQRKIIDVNKQSHSHEESPRKPLLPQFKPLNIQQQQQVQQIQPQSQPQPVQQNPSTQQIQNQWLQQQLPPNFPSTPQLEEGSFRHKIVSFLDFQRVLNFSNRLVVQPPQQATTKVYKAYITKGNNGVLIRAALKTRWWWSLAESIDEMENVNFLWTQWRKPQFFKFMKPKLEQAVKHRLEEDLTKSPTDLPPNAYNQATWQLSICDNQPKNLRKPFSYSSSQLSHIAQITNELDFEALKAFSRHKPTKKQLKQQLQQQQQQKAANESQSGLANVFLKESYEEDGGLESVYDAIIPLNTPSTWVFKHPLKQKVHNHMEFTFHLANKKALFYNMKTYYTAMNENVFDHLPVTFHIQQGITDPEFANFVDFFNNFEIENPKRRNVWIIKPGESSNRGNGIQVAGDVPAIRDIIKNRDSFQAGPKRTFIIQQYIDRPFLYNKRKFDIRCFMLMTNYNDNLKVYWYQEGYIRTSTREFTLKNLENRMIHLTNEAVQKRGDDFGKFENGNKLSYADFQKYIDIKYPKDNLNFMSTIYPRMKKLAYDSVCSVFTKIDKKKRNFSFELFGLDFMIDESFQTWLIEINTNPSLTIAAPLMSRLLPGLIDNVLKIAIDPIFPPPSFPKSKKQLIPEQIYENNKFDLLFDSQIDGPRLTNLYSMISSKSNSIYS